MGAAGDMLMAALYELLEDKESFICEMNALKLGKISALPCVKSGIAGTRMRVMLDGAEETSEDLKEIKEIKDPGAAFEESHAPEHIKSEEQPEHHAADFFHIMTLLNALPLPETVRRRAEGVYRLLAEAEAAVHQMPLQQIHYHEIGERDAVMDIVGVCLLMERLSPAEVVVSPIHVGSGYVRCAHGLLPVPAPAAAKILQGVPIYSGQIHGELCTPTGAALLKYFADQFGPMPVMMVSRIGYGMGQKDFPAVNCVRAFWGEGEENNGLPFAAPPLPNGKAAELRCSLDDMTGESIGYACELLLREGALDVFTTPIQMKKDRPGVLLTCLCDAEKAGDFAALLLKHTTTFGVRENICSRYTLGRNFTPRETPFGPIRVKTGTGYGMTKHKVEYEDAAAAARQNGVSLHDVLQAAQGGEEHF
jgi:uncharacterized protein (TIGR00299 family) protein